ncbi:hypothetical protein OJ997_35880 [Solirubrobacter phytolaccae]|uniref:Uncharacterized protein n=1 Tax=Solirubrobacter phytolaccae TaxID=1404360 RepID=A0A9X3NFG1_9ACTN|nr:hypothetical protein [Solirubrobacter phytolaccae]MDA0185740.1 hypothetical protein [Solirubrobacter phytolaccae]
MHVSRGRKHIATAVLSAAALGLSLAPTAHAQTVTNPADHPFPVTVTIDGQTYTDGRDTLPGFDDIACTAIPYVSYDFGQNLVIYKDSDGQILDTAKWTEWSRTTTYQNWLDDQKTPTPTATPTATTQATATPTASAGGGTTTTQTTNTGTTNQTSTTTGSTGKTNTTKSTTKTQTTKNSSGKSQTTKSTTNKSSNTKSSTTKSSSTATPTPTSTSTSSSSSSSSSSGSTTNGSTGTDTSSSAPDGGADAAVDPAATTDPAVAADTTGAGTDPAVQTGVADPAATTAVVAPNGQTVTPAGQNVPVSAGTGESAEQYQLASQTAGNVGDTRFAGILILVALTAVGFFCLAFGGVRQHLFGRSR